MCDNMKAQGLPMSTIVIIILVLIVLAAVGIMFFSYFMSGSANIGTGADVAGKGVDKFVTAAG